MIIENAVNWIEMKTYVKLCWGVSDWLRCSVFFLFAEPNSAQIQEAIGEAVNNIIKHFHKPEKEVSEWSSGESDSCLKLI